MRCIAAAIIALLMTVAPPPAAADEALLLEVVVNGHPIGKVGEFVLRDNVLLARRDELLQLGLRVADKAATDPDGLVRLADLPGVTARLEPATQTLYLTAGNDRLLPTLLQAGASSVAGAIESGTGATLNYDLTGTLVGGRAVGSGLIDLRAFSPWGVAASDVLGYAGASPNGPNSNAAIRLDSSYVYSDPASLRRYRLGDYINGGLGWTRPIRLGGIEINSDFSMRPDLVTFPLPSIGGSVAVPSTVDVLVNGTRLLSRELQPGPFQIPQIPVITGSGMVTMMLTDALGRQVTTTLPFYASSNLLAPGLQAYSVEVGAVRRNWGLVSNDYGSIVASGTYRRGLSEAVTVEGHAEGGAGLLLTGGGLAVSIGSFGVLNLAAAGSTGRHAGAQFSIGMQRAGPVFSVGASATVADRNFRDIAAVYGSPVARLQINANAGLSLGRFGSFGLAYTGIDRAAAAAPISIFVPPGSFLPTGAAMSGGTISTTGGLVSFIPAQHAHVASASYSVQIKNVAVFATGFRDFADRGNTGVLVGFTLPLGPRSSVSASAGAGSGGGYAQVQAMQSAASVGDLGYQVYGAAGAPDHAFAQLDYKSSHALLSVGADRLDRQSSLRTEAQGAVSYVDGGLFASNTIDDSFAVVDTNGTKGIGVLAENRDAGKTDAAGRLLIPDLRAFDLNHIAIEPTDVPIDATIPFTTREVRPQDRSGVVVRFPIHVSRGALLRLVDAAGQPLPVGSVATLRATGATTSVGYDGEAYVEDLDPHNVLAVEQPSGRRCVVGFDYRPVPEVIPTLGPLRCREASP